MSNAPRTSTRPPRAVASPLISSAARSTIARISTGASASSVGLAKFRKFVTTSAEGVRFVADALHVGLELGGKARRIEQATVAVNRRQTISKLVSDPGGQFAESRQAVLQTQLLFEVHDLREVGEQAHDAVRLTGLAADGRSGHTDMRGARSARGECHGAPDDGAAASVAHSSMIPERDGA